MDVILDKGNYKFSHRQVPSVETIMALSSVIIWERLCLNRRRILLKWAAGKGVYI